MAVGWARDGAVQEQIDASVADAVDRARNNMPKGESHSHCLECEGEIPLARRKAVPGVSLCIECQSELETKQGPVAGYNRRGSKDSQLK
ncbi:DksA/TraR family C4-type zinc finger protein [Geopsychrobacter electrodiphilus]|uniref:DksA/TraR family C4-type zinc finger protein n=1 Tax=Geopsychrobacter electrodiphilus TaxID=225196 RepID=UPI0003612701|nr:DksA/TraR family C4-type zinc finger protein [Geopsychrobacter electrodiphilus]